MLFVIQTIIFAIFVFQNIDFLNANGPHGVTNQVFVTSADRVTNYLRKHARQIDEELLKYETVASSFFDDTLTPALDKFFEASRDHLAHLKNMKDKLTVIEKGFQAVDGRVGTKNKQLCEAIEAQTKRCKDVSKKITKFLEAKDPDAKLGARTALVIEIEKPVTREEVDQRKKWAAELDLLLKEVHKPASCVAFDPTKYEDVSGVH